MNGARALHLLVRLVLCAGCVDAFAGSNPIQVILDDAADHETIVIPSGVYKGSLQITRPVTLEAGHGGAVIQGPGEGDVLKVNAPDVTIRGFTIRGTGNSLDRENAGIVVTAPRVVIENNHLQDVLFGIYLKDASDGTIRGNRIESKPLPEPRRGDAIRLWQSSGSVIEQNIVHASRDVIVWFSSDVVLRENRVTGGRYGMHFMYSSDTVLEDNILTDNSVGMFLMYSDDLTLRRNVMARNRGPSGFGIGLKDMDGLLAEDNILVGNRIGLHLDNSPSDVDIEHLLRRNVIAYNDVGIGMLPNVTRNIFTENTIAENVEQVSILGSGSVRGNRFAVEGRGNFWSDYQGFDLDDDGVGDFPYEAKSFFENLIDKEPRLRFFLFSPSHHAINMATRAFPIVEPRVKVTDPAPLMSMVDPVKTGGAAELEGRQTSAWLLLLCLATLFTLPAVMIGQWQITRELRVNESKS